MRFKGTGSVKGGSAGLKAVAGGFMAAGVLLGVVLGLAAAEPLKVAGLPVT